MSSPANYTSTAKLFHWITAAAVIGLLILGHYMTSLELSPLMLKLFSWHKWIGLTVLALTVLRLGWRIMHRPPALPQTMTGMQKFLAHGGHLALYGLLLAMPLLGWLHSSAAGFPVVLFGVLPLPNLVAADKALADSLGFAHWIGGWALVALIIGHAGAALWHHYKLGDDVLQRMLPGTSSRNVASWLMGAVIATMLVSPAFADDQRSWTLEEASKFTFTAKQVNVPIAGEFKSFTAKIRFDPATPETAAIALTVDASSITTGNAQADQLLPGADWFAVAEHPQATFNATGFTATGGDTYEVAGELTLKGTTQPVTVTATITIADHPDDPARQRATASGSATVSRTAFKIGQGQWADTNTIADEVVVAFEFTAHSTK